jgi:hypothetical protein
LLEGIVALADASVPYVCPYAFIRVNTTLIFESGVVVVVVVVVVGDQGPEPRLRLHRSH